MNYRKLADELLGIQLMMTRLHSEVGSTKHVQGEKGVLIYLDHTQEQTTPTQIAEFLGVTTARTASILNSLEKKGVIARSMDPRDRRKIIVEITEKGKGISKEGKNTAITNVSEILEALGEKDASEYVRIMTRIVTYLENEKEGSPID
ncbi:DNA-binding transcriptional regulator, MarR family [Halolactibacillus halophilus]|uniref:DNA-binding transcriptional regulator, MarR family n=1 Tax=Halolactibacillus halophilus TaxID=306540 RepID=A0A1I5QU44_9BACI|nr:MarR family transcriptional regulator [Halolactibacillus halophilus]GEM01918.1 MarR family transcriptional regulator [Halolactibacillus halophilus]SFP49607.1 DNA-binding transcriptional regulator, MarR family [Halolactibacillus halophilus]